MWEQGVNCMSAAPGSVLRCTRDGFMLHTVPGFSFDSMWVDGHDLEAL